MPDYQVVASGSFISDGTQKDIPLRSDFDFFEVENHTQMGDTQTPGRGVEFSWRRGYADDSATMISKEDGVDTVTFEVVSSGGFRRVDQSVQTLGAAQATSGTDVTAANPAVVTVAGHGYSNGDRIRIYGTTGMLQIAGYDFTIGNVGANDFELSYLDASGFAAVATAGFVRKVPNNPIFSPQLNRITGITAASSMVVTLAVTHGLTVGQKIRLEGLESFGMIEAEGLIGEITAVSTANNTITLNIDSSAFTAFAFPTSAIAALGVTPAYIVPVGEIATVLDGAIENTAEIVMELAAGVDSPAGSSDDVIYWRALSSGYRNNE